MSTPKSGTTDGVAYLAGNPYLEGGQVGSVFLTIENLPNINNLPSSPTGYYVSCSRGSRAPAAPSSTNISPNVASHVHE